MDERIIKSPKHYTEGRKFEPKNVIRDWGLNFNLGSAVKYLSRAGRKDNIVQDLKKAQEFIQFEIDALEAERKEGRQPEAPKHPNCKCAVHKYPIFKDMEDGKGVSCGIIEMEIPVGTSPEELIPLVIKKLYGVEE